MKIIRLSIYPSFFFGGIGFFLWLLHINIFPVIASIFSIGFLGVAVFFLEKYVPFNADWNQSQGDLKADIIHNIVNFILIAASFEIWEILKTKFYNFDIWPSKLPFPLQILAAGLLIDLGMYWVHRLSHYIPSLWALHSVHHSSERLYWLNGEKRHPLHAILEGFPGVSLALALGAPSTVVLGWLTILSLHLMFQHGNIEYEGGILKNIFSVAELHRWHHRRKYVEAQVNYGAVFSFWDRIFRSFHSDSRLIKGNAVGLEEKKNFPKNYISQLAEPFR